MYKRIVRYSLTLLLPALLVFLSGNGYAAAIITITPAGATDYSIATTDLPESAGMELVITYDTATLEAPLVKAGALTAGAMMEKNIGSPGTIRLVFITAGSIKGSGQLAAVAFTKKGSGPAPLPRLTSSVYSTTGTQLAVQSSAPQPQPQTSAADADTAGSAVSGASQVTASTSTAPTSTAPTSTAPASAGTSGNGTSAVSRNLVQSGSSAVMTTLSQPAAEQGILPQDATPAEESHADPLSRALADSAAPAGTALPVHTGEDAAVTVPAAKADDIPVRQQLKTSRSVAERFRTFDGVRTVKNFAQLFDVTALHAAGIVQAPAIAISDGSSLVKITVERVDTGDEPSFSLKGANQKALKRVSDTKWELAALPQKGKTDVRLSIILKNERTEIPLVVVQQLDKTKTHLPALAESALNALLAKPVVNKKPAYDLNSDGKQDYLDDYLLIAHWLLKQQPAPKGVSPKPAATGK